MGQVQNGCLYIRYRIRSPKETKQRSEKVYRLHPLAIIIQNLLYSFSNLYQVQENQTWKFQFGLSPFFFLSFFLSSSPSHVTQKLFDMCKYCAQQTTALLMEIIPTCFELLVRYDCWVMASKLSLRRLVFSIEHFLCFSCNNFVDVAACVTCHGEFVRN